MMSEEASEEEREGFGILFFHLSLQLVRCNRIELMTRSVRSEKLSEEHHSDELSER